MTHPYRGIAHRDLLCGIKQYLDVQHAYHISLMGGLGIRAGSPDILAGIKHPSTGLAVLIAVEAKTGTGRLSEHQKREKGRLEAAGAVYVLARSLLDVEDALVAAGLVTPALMRFGG